MSTSEKKKTYDPRSGGRCNDFLGRIQFEPVSSSGSDSSDDERRDGDSSPDRQKGSPTSSGGSSTGSSIFSGQKRKSRHRKKKTREGSNEEDGSIVQSTESPSQIDLSDGFGDWSPDQSPDAAPLGYDSKGLQSGISFVNGHLTRSDSGIRRGFSQRGREYFAIGFYTWAVEACRRDEDVVGWAVAHLLTGHLDIATSGLEDFVIAACESVLADMIVNTPRRLGLTERSRRPRSDQLFRGQQEEVMREVCCVINRAELVQWYLVCILLHQDFELPDNPWIAPFFSLLRGGGVDVDSPSGRTYSKHGGYSAREMSILSKDEIETSLMLQCSRAQILFVNMYVSWILHRYRVAIESATTLIEHLDENDIAARFVRLHSTLTIGNRNVAIEDTFNLMKSTSVFVKSVAHSIAIYAIPLDTARSGIKWADLHDEEAQYCYAIGEWVHALTLFQLSEKDAAAEICDQISHLAIRHNLEEWIMDLRFVCAVAMRDERSILGLSLTPERQLHLALCGALGGGCTTDDDIIRITTDVNINRLIDPETIYAYGDCRVLVPFHYMRARALFADGELQAAWEEVQYAVESCREVMGSFEFYSSDCAPHRVLFAAITIGLAYLETFLNADDNPHEDEEARERRLYEEDLVGDEIILKCKEWSTLIRTTYPKMVLGYAASSLVSVTARDDNAIERAEQVENQFPTSVHAMNALSLALHSQHLDSDARANAQRAIDTYPHVPEVRDMFRTVTEGAEPLHTVLYRNVLPITCGTGSGESAKSVVRDVTIMAIVLAQILAFFLLVISNLNSLITFPDSAQSFVDRLHVPHTSMLYVTAIFFFYTLLATVMPRSLIVEAFDELYVRNTKLNRFVFAGRGILIGNTGSVALIFFLGNGFNVHWIWNVVLFGIQWLLFLPFTTRYFFLWSKDEPNMEVGLWVIMLILDFALYLVSIVPHVILVCFEPLIFILYGLFGPTPPTATAQLQVLTKIRLRQAEGRDDIPLRPADRTKRTFFYFTLLKAFFYHTHSSVRTAQALQHQEQVDDSRVYPSINVAEKLRTHAMKAPRRTGKSLKPKDAASGIVEVTKLRAERLLEIRQQEADHRDHTKNADVRLTVNGHKVGSGEGAEETQSPSGKGILHGKSGGGDGSSGAMRMHSILKGFRRRSLTFDPADVSKSKTPPSVTMILVDSPTKHGGGDTTTQDTTKDGTSATGEEDEEMKVKPRLVRRTSSFGRMKQEQSPEKSPTRSAKPGEAAAAKPVGGAAERMQRLNNFFSQKRRATHAADADAPLDATVDSLQMTANSSHGGAPSVTSATSAAAAGDEVDQEGDTLSMSVIARPSTRQRRKSYEAVSSPPGGGGGTSSEAEKRRQMLGTSLLAENSREAVHKNGSAEPVSAPERGRESTTPTGRLGRRRSSTQLKPRMLEKSAHDYSVEISGGEDGSLQNTSSLIGSLQQPPGKTTSVAAAAVSSSATSSPVPEPAGSPNPLIPPPRQATSEEPLSGGTTERVRSVQSCDDDDDEFGTLHETTNSVDLNESEDETRRLTRRRSRKSIVSFLSPGHHPPDDGSGGGGGSTSANSSRSPTPTPTQTPRDNKLTSASSSSPPSPALNGPIPQMNSGGSNDFVAFREAGPRDNDGDDTRRSSKTPDGSTEEERRDRFVRRNSLTQMSAVNRQSPTDGTLVLSRKPSLRGLNRGVTPGSDNGGSPSPEASSVEPNGERLTRRNSFKSDDDIETVRLAEAKRRAAEEEERRAAGDAPRRDEADAFARLRSREQKQRGQEKEQQRQREEAQRKAEEEEAKRRHEQEAARQEELAQRQRAAVEKQRAEQRKIDEIKKAAAAESGGIGHAALVSKGSGHRLLDADTSGSPHLSSREVSPAGTNASISPHRQEEANLPKPVNGNMKMRNILGELHTYRTAAQQRSIGDGHGFSDAQHGALKEATRRLADAKRKAAIQITAIGERITIEMFEVKKLALSVVEETFEEGDTVGGNPQLLQALTRVISIDVPTIAHSRQWLLSCAREGYPAYLDILLKLPAVAATLDNPDDVLVPFLAACLKNTSQRAQLFAVVLRNINAVYGFVLYHDKLVNVWQKAFELLSQKPSSDQAADPSFLRGRMEALEGMLKVPKLMSIDFMREASDRRTIFTRAAREGEISVMELIMKKATNKPDLNKLLSDESTALMQAIVGNQPGAVAFILRQSGVDVRIRSKKVGTALELVEKMKNRDPRIINMIREADKDGVMVSPGQPAFLDDETKAGITSHVYSSPADILDIVDGTIALKPMLVGGLPQFEAVDEILKDTSSDQRVVKQQLAALEKTKMNLITKIKSLKGRVKIDPSESPALVSIIDYAIQQNERRGGSIELVDVCLTYTVGIDWAKEMVQRKWLISAASTSSVQFVTLLVTRIRSSGFAMSSSHAADIVRAFSRSSSSRIPLMLSLLKGEDVLDMKKRGGELSPLFTEVFENVASAQRTIPREDRNGRMELLTVLINHPHLNLDCCQNEGADGQTIFSRAAKEGDVELVNLLLNTPNVVKDVNRVQSDRSTALISAVYGNHVATVERLLQSPSISVTYRSPQHGGTALEIAIDSQRDPVMVAVLKAKIPRSDGGTSPGVGSRHSADSALHASRKSPLFEGGGSAASRPRSGQY